MGKITIQDHMGFGTTIHLIGEVEGERPKDLQEVRWEKDGVHYRAKAYMLRNDPDRWITVMGAPRHIPHEGNYSSILTGNGYSLNIGTVVTWD